MFKKLENKKGVTLVELLAVVVIMGIVAAIAVPTIGGLIARQQQNADEATFVQLEEAARLYAVDDADGVFTLADLSTDLDLRDNVISVDLTGAGTTVSVVVPAELRITVTGSTVAFAYTNPSVDTTIDLYVNDTVVVNLGA